MAADDKAAPPRACSIDGCAKPVHAKRLCSAHYHRVRRHGDPLAQVPVIAGLAGLAASAKAGPR